MKRNSTNYWIYLGMMTVFCALIYFALCTGQHIDHSEVSSTVNTEMSSFELFKRIISRQPDKLTNDLVVTNHRDFDHRPYFLVPFQIHRATRCYG